MITDKGWNIFLCDHVWGGGKINFLTRGGLNLDGVIFHPYFLGDWKFQNLICRGVQ